MTVRERQNDIYGAEREGEKPIAIVAGVIQVRMLDPFAGEKIGIEGWTWSNQMSLTPAKLDAWVAMARDRSASDLHLEAGLPLAMRVAGRLVMQGEPISPRVLMDATRQAVGEESWQTLLTRRSCDVSRAIAGVRCRINAMQTARGIGLSVRLLASGQPTLDSLNLHPDLARLALADNGLVLVCGATGSGKSSTMAALVETINRSKARHIITIEQPIEYWLTPRRSYIRQREVGRDTPSFEQALHDALREDPDVIVVGEMRRPQTMALTLDAAETGHLVLATMHASAPHEALARIVASFPSDAQAGVRAQLAGCLRAVVCQTLPYHPAAGMRVPELEVLVTTGAVANHVREGAFFKLSSATETGAADGMWSRSRYRRWLDSRATWVRPQPAEKTEEPPPRTAPKATPAVRSQLPTTGAAPQNDGVLVVGDDADLSDIIAQLERR